MNNDLYCPKRPQDYEESIKAIEISAKKAQEAIEVFKQCLDKAEEQAKQILNGIPTGKWIITAEDNDGVHRIQCPFCRYEKGSDFIDYITVTFEKFPPFCENCGAKMDGQEADNETD